MGRNDLIRCLSHKVKRPRTQRMIAPTRSWIALPDMSRVSITAEHSSSDEWQYQKLNSVPQERLLTDHGKISFSRADWPIPIGDDLRSSTKMSRHSPNDPYRSNLPTSDETAFFQLRLPDAMASTLCWPHNNPRSFKRRPIDEQIYSSLSARKRGARVRSASDRVCQPDRASV
jgi:hypothetical protein